MTLQQLREKHANQLANLKGINAKAVKESRDLTEAEQAEWDAQEAAANTTLAAIARMEATETHSTAAAASAARAEEVVPAVTRGAQAGSTASLAGARANKDFDNFGEFVQAVRFRPDDSRLADLYNEPGDVRGEQRMDTGSQGGFMVPKQFLAELRSLDPTDAIIRPRATVIPAGTPPDAEIDFPFLDQTATSNMFGGIGFQWIGEGDSKPDTGIKIKQGSLKPWEIAGSLVITDKLLRNAPAMTGYLTNLFRQAGAQAEEAAFIRGDGVKKPLGILNAPATIKVNRGTANTITIDDLANMVNVFKGKRGTWILPLSARSQIAKFRDPAGNFVYIPAQNGFPATLFGYELQWTDNTSALGTSGDVILADLSNYLIKDGSGPFIATSEHVYFQQNKTMIKYFWNVDGQPWLNAPVKGNDGILYSPFVALN